MGAFEEFSYGDKTGFLGQTRMASLSASNANYNRAERFLTSPIRVTQLQTSGYHTRACEGPDSDPREQLYLTICISGKATLKNQKSTHKISPGDIYINYSQNYRLWCYAGQYRRVMFPKSVFQGLDRTTEEALIIRESDPVGTVLKSTLTSLIDTTKSGDAAQVKWMSDLMVSVSQTILDATLSKSPTSGYDHIRDKAMTYIRENLQRVDLSVAEVAAYVHVSRATLYRAFENVGGLKDFITSERVALAKSMLSVGRLDRGFVTSVAYGAGFSSPEHFSKVFKSRTGLTPTQFVACG